MTPVLLSVIAVVAYLFGGINGSVLLSRRVFKKDIRRLGSRNASLANFMQVFGTKMGAAVVGVDAAKTLIPGLLGMLLMSIPGTGYPKIGVLFAGFCTVLGDCFPWRYRFKGNMGVTCCAAALWLTDWRIGLIACVFYGVTLLFSRMVSLAGLVLCAAGPILCWCFVPAEQLRGQAGLLALLAACVVAFRQRAAIRRIVDGTEPRVRLGRQANDRMKNDGF